MLHTDYAPDKFADLEKELFNRARRKWLRDYRCGDLTRAEFRELLSGLRRIHRSKLDKLEAALDMRDYINDYGGL